MRDIYEIEDIQDAIETLRSLPGKLQGEGSYVTNLVVGAIENLDIVMATIIPEGA